MNKQNINVTNGYVHIIDTVLTLPPPLQDLLVNAGYSSLLGAFNLASQAGLTPSDVTAIRMPTVFAPTNQAFENIGSALGSLTPQDVANILMYHVVDMQAFASDLVDGQQLPTLAGENCTVTIRQGDNGPMVFINGAMVVQPNLALDAGVVHGIDQYVPPLPPF